MSWSLYEASRAHVAAFELKDLLTGATPAAGDIIIGVAWGLRGMGDVGDVPTPAGYMDITTLIRIHTFWKVSDGTETYVRFDNSGSFSPLQANIFVFHNDGAGVADTSAWGGSGTSIFAPTDPYTFTNADPSPGATHGLSVVIVTYGVLATDVTDIQSGSAGWLKVGSWNAIGADPDATNIAVMLATGSGASTQDSITLSGGGLFEDYTYSAFHIDTKVYANVASLPVETASRRVRTKELPYDIHSNMADIGLLES